MTPFTKTLIGHITDVNTSEFNATLVAETGDRLPGSVTNPDKVLIGQPGSHVAIMQGDIKILAQINEVNEKDSVKSANFAYPYAGLDGKIERVPFWNLDALAPAGSINAHMNDYVKWLQMNLNGGDTAFCFYGGGYFRKPFNKSIII